MSRRLVATIPVFATSDEVVTYPHVSVHLGDLAGPAGNAFAVLAAFERALRAAGIDPAPLLAEATADDYDHLLALVRASVYVTETTASPLPA